MRWMSAVICSLLCTVGTAQAAECPGNPDALGTSRIISIDPTEHSRLGTMQYSETLPLRDKEIVLTFDDGPLPPYTTRVLKILESECVKATYFMVGNMARAYPDMVRRIYAAGHTVGTHSHSHPMTFRHMPLERVEYEVDAGIAQVGAALGNPKLVAPFFRIPGLSRSASIEGYLHGRGLTTWSADFPADDWKHIQAQEIIRRALDRIEAKGRGILLLHDIQPATALALPQLLHELKVRGYRIVHVVPASVEQPKTQTTPQDWTVLRGRQRKAWPRVVETDEAHEPLNLRPAVALTTPVPAPEPPTQSIDTPTSIALPTSSQPISRKPKVHVSRRPAFLTPLVLSN